MISITEKLSYSTVRIECEYKDGSRGTGTGFFFEFLRDEATGTHVPVVITNKHVVRDSIKGWLIFTTKGSDHKPLDKQHFKVAVSNFEPAWRFHPDDSVDLCAMALGDYVHIASARGIELFYLTLSKLLIPTDSQLSNLSAVEDILMVGYPDGIWDHVNNKPVFRKGVSATHPNFDYCGKKEIMIDAACFPGSSGSPVFIYNSNGFSDKNGNIYLGETRLLLLGILYAGPQHTTTGEVRIVNVPTVQKPLVISSIPNNLGLIIKAERILELEPLFKM